MFIDHLSFAAGFVNESPSYFIVVAVFPPLVGSVRWPAIALCLAFGRRFRWLYVVPALLLVMYVANAIYWWNAEHAEYIHGFVKSYTRMGAFFFWTTLHMFLHAGFGGVAIVMMVSDLRKGRIGHTSARGTT